MSLLSLRFVVVMDLLLFFALQNHGCTGGKVMDENGLPLIGAKAVCDDLPAIGPVFSDGTGVYKWPDGAVPEGPHTFTVSMAGHDPVTIKAIVKYTVAPGHTAAEGLVFQIPDARMRKALPGARDQGGGTKPAPVLTLPSDRVTTREQAGKAGQDPFSDVPDKPQVATTTFPALPPTITLPPAPTIAIATLPKASPTTTIVLQPLQFPTLPPILVPTSTTAQIKVTSTVATPAKISTTTVLTASRTTTPRMPPSTVPLAPPGQWYQSPDQRYSFSAPMNWKVGFQGNKAYLGYEAGSCALLQIIIQVNETGRPKGNVIRQSSTVFSGMDVQVRTYDTGMEGYFFSCSGEQYSIFKIRPGTCEAPGIEAAEQEAMLIITNLQCRK